jgi:adenylate kinase
VEAPHNTKLPQVLILLGAPGSGKDTQAFALAKHFGYFVLVTGDLFRSEVAHETPAGKKMKEIKDKGELLPADTVGEIVEAELERHKSTIEANGLLFDGYPRLEDEIADCERLIERFGLGPDLAILLDVRDKELLKRLAARGRADDSPEVARERIAVYRHETAPVIEYYRGKKKLLVIDGNPPIDKVTENLLSKLEQLAT